MKTLKKIIRHYSSDFTFVGEVDEEKTLEENIVEIKKDLNKLIKRNYRMIIVFSIILIVFIAFIIIFSIVKKEINSISTLISITGLAPVVFLGVIKSLWKDKINADILLKMVEGLNQDSFHSILKIFVTLYK